jgi:hypothetical protein
MLLELTTTQRPATDLGFLLHKNPARAQSFELSFGRGHVFYPEASALHGSAAARRRLSRARPPLARELMLQVTKIMWHDYEASTDT